MAKVTDIMELVKNICKRNGATITNVEKHGNNNLIDFTTKSGKQWCLDIKDSIVGGFTEKMQWELTIFSSKYNLIDKRQCNQDKLFKKAMKMLEDATADKARGARFEIIGQSMMPFMGFAGLISNPFLLQTEQIYEMLR